MQMTSSILQSLEFLFRKLEPASNQDSIQMVKVPVPLVFM